MENQNEKLVAALIGGAVVGAVLAVLFAPSKGSELRAKIAEDAGGMKDALEGKMQEITDFLDSVVNVYKEVKSR